MIFSSWKNDEIGGSVGRGDSGYEVGVAGEAGERIAKDEGPHALGGGVVIR